MVECHNTVKKLQIYVNVIDKFHWHVANICPMTPMRVLFSRAAATLSLSANCLLTSSDVLWVPFFMRTSSLKRGGSACSSLTRTPKPITVARLQWVMVGVIKTVTVLRAESGLLGREGVMLISGKDTTARDPKEIGCSGSDIDDIRSVGRGAN